jgi:hypothetical protein
MAADTENIRSRKRQRIDSLSISSEASTSTQITAIDHSLRAPVELRTAMRLSGSDQDSALSVSLDEPGPLDGIPPSNGHTNGNGFSVTNGSSGLGIVAGNGIHKHVKGVSRVSLPGTTLYDGSHIDREEFVRLVIQSLKDIGYR